LLLGLIALVGLAQLFPGDSVLIAGLVKPAYHAGQWWRLLTAPFLHGNLIHFLLNAAALLYLGKRVEVFARWPHLPMVFLFSACVGGELSARFVPSTSVGASGGLMGLLGFLLVFESLHSRLVPRSARRRLLAGVLLTALIGLVGYRFIDNAAHAGGLIAGMLYAIVVFPKSASSYRPNATISDRVAGVGALVLLILSALFTVFRIAIL
jgi:membrane associated rhomboid family serine protease